MSFIQVLVWCPSIARLALRIKLTVLLEDIVTVLGCQLRQVSVKQDITAPPGQAAPHRSSAMLPHLCIAQLALRPHR
jgi:hypothetical protein